MTEFAAVKRDVLDRIEDIIGKAEDSTEPRKVLEEARDLLAEAALQGEELDTARLEWFMLRSAKNYQREGTDEALLAWAPFLGACADYIREGVVGMRDGRLATPEGWDYTNCEPVQGYATFSRETWERLERFVRERAGPAPPKETEAHIQWMLRKREIHDEFMETALREYLDRKER